MIFSAFNKMNLVSDTKTKITLPKPHPKDNILPKGRPKNDAKRLPLRPLIPLHTKKYPSWFTYNADKNIKVFALFLNL
jgi:hypothetical protein